MCSLGPLARTRIVTGPVWTAVEKFREKFRETSSTPPPSAHNRPQADLILVLGRDLVREDFQSVPELTVHFCIGRCTLALPAFPAGPDSLYCSMTIIDIQSFAAGIEGGFLPLEQTRYYTEDTGYVPK